MQARNIFLTLVNVLAHLLLGTLALLLPIAIAALVLNLLVMSLVYFMFETWGDIRLGNWYYRKLPQEWRFYRSIGIDYVKRGVTHTPIRYFNRRIRVDFKHRRKPSQVLYFLKEAETAHVLDLLIIIALALALVYFNFLLSVLIFVIGLPLNILPIFLQRFNQIRVECIFPQIERDQV